MISQRSTSVRALVIISTTVAAFVLLLATAVHALSSGDPTPTVDYRVHAGDTLWSIATEITEPGHDIRSTIAMIEGLNGLDGGYLQIGQTLSIPDPAEVS
jgi:LysM repeat protein